MLLLNEYWLIDWLSDLFEVWTSEGSVRRVPVAVVVAGKANPRNRPVDFSSLLHDYPVKITEIQTFLVKPYCTSTPKRLSSTHVSPVDAAIFFSLVSDYFSFAVFSANNQWLLQPDDRI